MAEIQVLGTSPAASQGAGSGKKGTVEPGAQTRHSGMGCGHLDPCARRSHGAAPAQPPMPCGASVLDRRQLGACGWDPRAWRAVRASAQGASTYLGPGRPAAVAAGSRQPMALSLPHSCVCYSHHLGFVVLTCSGPALSPAQGPLLGGWRSGGAARAIRAARGCPAPQGPAHRAAAFAPAPTKVAERLPSCCYSDLTRDQPCSVSETVGSGRARHRGLWWREQPHWGVLGRV